MRICTKCGARLDAGERCHCGSMETVSIYKSRRKPEEKPKSDLAKRIEEIVRDARERYLNG